MRRFRLASLTTLGLVALVAGFSIGWLGRGYPSGPFAWLAEAAKPTGDLWIAALQLMVLPIVVTQVLTAITNDRNRGALGTLGVRTVLTFVAMLVVAGVVTRVAMPLILANYHVDVATADTLRHSVSVPPSAQRMATSSNIFTVLLLTVLFGFAVTRLEPDRRTPLTNIFQSLAEVVLIAVRWILWVTPVGVFALTYGMARTAGRDAFGFVLLYVVVICGVLFGFTLLLYPLSALVGRVSIRTFCSAVLPAQMVALSTRSSIAALPALVEQARDKLNLPASMTGFVLPVAVSIFKVNRTVSSTVTLLFLAHVFGVAIDVPTFARFLVTVIILSFGTPGEAAGQGFTSMPAYLAAGVPIEGVVVLSAAKIVPDMFKTLLNVTSDMSVATWLSRSARVPARERPLPNQLQERHTLSR